MKIYVDNGCDTLKSCLLCYPANYRITSKSNRFYNKVDYTLALNQYNRYINYLIENGVKPIFIDITSSSKQVYAKDIAFVIENFLFISKMSLKEREVEINPIKKLASKENLDYYIMQNNIEGGDVVVGDKVIFVGVSSRTNLDAIEELKKILIIKGIKKEVISINFDNSMLHLDCVFGLLGGESALLSPYVYDKEVVKKYIKNIIEVTKEEADNFATNIVYLGDKKLVTSNISIGNKLKELGYNVKILDYTEIVKGEGSVDCSTLDLLRE
ncbi:dimethylarginine dimethylaminohydrolase family protein [Clostridium paraputrificum]|uniref:dimethylarginine dimethylaminohydrolase family protein n=1 Tax=Clostridium paraputrificum TaxID=29363 RepID=UPI003D355FD3